ncbi:glycosyltransferase family 2 protein [Christiangramia salexigens]|uniref:Glycosyl transferase family 2 n=1 Tax=Christiangramia salexigens TaxID=1913577 RepID=A0A1L3J4F4_9FLAO|nr:glycosyltransferase family 2 protein [Christiangramia salexigens]APG59984.1 glycosyl transferase family 2 [Christiangramia salexigens]
MDKPSVSVIISTYNSVEWLRKTLLGFENQTYSDFEIVIADDGSGPETRQFLEAFSKQSEHNLKHVWHPDDGFQKTKILNKAVENCQADYILMTDGDCIPRKDFLQTHIEHREKGYFLSGGYFKLPMDISESIKDEDIKTQVCFDITWLKDYGLKSSFKNKKLTAGKREARVLNNLTPTNASWNGHNSSGWKSDILAVNGFDERMQYGGEDRELGERLFNYGIRSKQIRYSAVCLHLDHSRGYVNEEAIQINKKIREKTKKEKLSYTEFGIKRSS